MEIHVGAHISALLATNELCVGLFGALKIEHAKIAQSLHSIGPTCSRSVYCYSMYLGCILVTITFIN